MAPTMPLNHLFEHGNYVGNKTPPTKNAPMDNNFLTSTTSIVHRIDNIGDLAIVNSNGRLLNKQQISYILFDFKEQRNQGTAAVVDIENHTNSWLTKGSGKKSSCLSQSKYANKSKGISNSQKRENIA
jgi:hypothetical protein